MKSQKILIVIASVIVFLLTSYSALFAVIPLPARIGGTVTVDGTLITESTDAGYTFAVTKQDGTAYTPAAEDVDGLNATNWYIINVPIYDAEDQPGGAHPDEAAVLHVYLNGTEIRVTSPANGAFIVGSSGSTNNIDIVAQACIPTAEVCDGLDNDCDGLIDEDGGDCLYHSYDVDQNGKIGDFELLDAIDAWAAGNLGDFELLDLIDFWAAGCYHWDVAAGSHKAGC